MDPMYTELIHHSLLIPYRSIAYQNSIVTVPKHCVTELSRAVSERCVQFYHVHHVVGQFQLGAQRPPLLLHLTGYILQSVVSQEHWRPENHAFIVLT